MIVLAVKTKVIEVHNKASEKSIFVNTDKFNFATVPNPDLELAKSVIESFVDLKAPNGKNFMSCFSPENNDFLKSFSAIQSSKEFDIKIVGLLERLLLGFKKVESGPRTVQKSWLLRLLFRLTSEGLLMFPAGYFTGEDNVFNQKAYSIVVYHYCEHTCGDHLSFISSFHESGILDHHSNKKGAIARLRRLCACAVPVVSYKDFSDQLLEVVGENLSLVSDNHFRYLILALDAVSKVQPVRGINKLDLPAFYEKYSPSKQSLNRRTGNKKTDQEFRWLSNVEDMDAWREAGIKHLKSIVGRKTLSNEICSLNKFFSFIISRADVPRDPQLFFRTGTTFGQDLIDHVLENITSDSVAQMQLSRILSFMQHFIDENFCEESDDGTYKYLIPGYGLPFDADDMPIQDNSSAAIGQTHRIPMPTRFVEILRQILIDDEFKWAKETFYSDYFTYIDPETGTGQKIWSPIRTLFMILRTRLPIRTIQGQMLDSGEGDSYWYDPQQGWVDNVGPFANYWGNASASRGVLRKIWDPEKESFYTGLYINTNKTQDRLKEYLELGYEIPWHNDEIINLLAYVRDFQIKYNPVASPCKFIKTEYGPNVGADVLPRIPDRFYLFRDPCAGNNPTTSEAPVTSGRLQTYWVTLMRALEDRLYKEGILNEDGSRINIVTGKKKCLFDQHGLRVTTLTAFAKSGVPIEILSKVIAGHASILMTLHYTKFDISHVTEILDNAGAVCDRGAQKDLANWLKSKSIEDAMGAIAFNDYLSASRGITDNQTALWGYMDHGICPNGRSMCNSGGDVVLKNKDRIVHAPVFGGPGSCANCRFFFTGPQFLLGLKAKFDELSLAVEEKAAFWRKKNSAKKELQDEKYRCAAEERHFNKEGALKKADEQCRESLEQLDVLCHSLHNTYNLARQALRLLEIKEDNSASTDLIVNSTHKSILEECSSFELADAVCQQSTIFESINSTDANRKRTLQFARAVLNSGKVPLFLSFTEEQQHLAINAAVKYAFKRFGRDMINSAVDGIHCLPESFYEDVEECVQASLGKGFQLTGPALGFPQISDVCIEKVKEVECRGA